MGTIEEVVMMKLVAKIRPALSVLGIVLSVVVGYNTWAQIDAANGDLGGNSHTIDG